MTNGCLGALESAAKAEKAEAEDEERCAGEEVAEAGGDDRRPSRRRPEKWGPEAASIT
jgi:hypothetical protein